MIEQDLKKLSVYELRMLAREVGVRSPTSKSCEQMINEIIAIQNGELAPVTSKMGRPPKSRGMNLDNLKQVVNASCLRQDMFEPIKKTTNYGFCDANLINKSNQTYEFMGVVRELDDYFYVQDYLNNVEFVTLSKTNNLKAGDLVKGKAQDFDSNIKKAQDYEMIELCGDNNPNDKFLIKKFSETSSVYNYINEQGGNNIILEVESSKRMIINHQINKNIFIHSNKCDDILTTYNVLLDLKNCIKKLCEEEKNFTLYMVDVEYIYYILTMYYEYKKAAADINAGQYFKEIFTYISNNKNANLVIFEKENSIKSSYLELIIDRYLK